MEGASLASDTVRELKVLHATTLFAVGHWMASTRIESAENIITTYMKPASEMLSAETDEFNFGDLLVQ